MSEKRFKKAPKGRRVLSIVLFALAAVLLVASVAGYVLRSIPSSRNNLDRMRPNAVVYSASDFLVNEIARLEKETYYYEVICGGKTQPTKEYRSLGNNRISELQMEVEQAARAEAEALYGNPVVQDPEAINANATTVKDTMIVYSAQEEVERANYADIYVQLKENVPDWTDVMALGDRAAVIEELGKTAPALLEEGNAHLHRAFYEMAKSEASKEQKRDDKEMLSQLISMVNGTIGDWEELSELNDDALWEKLVEEVPVLEEQSQFKKDIIEDAKGRIEAAVKGEPLSESGSSQDEGVEPAYGTQVDYTYFNNYDGRSAVLVAMDADRDEAFAGLRGELFECIPELEDLLERDGRIPKRLRETIEKVVWPGSDNFATRYETYAANNALNVLSEREVFLMEWAFLAEKLMLAFIAIALLGVLLMYWDQLTGRFGIPRTIIALFFIYLCLIARLCKISVPMMLGNTLERMCMYGLLVLAMMPGIQCGIGLNMGMTIGCISGLLGIVLALQFNMTGFTALAFACVSGAVLGVPLGWGYSKLLNRMKGNEMTISTYVGFSFVSLMCIAWMLLPFDNPKIVWLLSGKGLRVTHSLLGNFAHMLDNLLSFTVFGMKVPTGGILFLVLCCGLMWLFSHTRTGIAMTAAGSNPRFAEASGINVDHMRTIGTTLSTVIAAVGIVIYSQAFGYAQLYTAPRQLGFIAASAILIGGATVHKARVGHVLLGVFLFQGVLVFGQQIANAALSGGGLSEVMRILISNGIILYALTQSGGGKHD